MRRMALRVAAWVGVTGLSVFVANAAVGSVRNQVSDLPQAALAAPAITTATSAAPTTTVAPTTTSTTPPTAAPSELATYTLTGGTVSFEAFADRIVLLGALPATGWTVEEVEQTTTRIEIEFTSGSAESKFTATLSGGQVLVQVEEPSGVEQGSIQTPASSTSLATTTTTGATSTTIDDDHEDSPDSPDEPDEDRSDRGGGDEPDEPDDD